MCIFHSQMSHPLSCPHFPLPLPYLHVCRHHHCLTGDPSLGPTGELLPPLLALLSVSFAVGDACHLVLLPPSAQPVIPPPCHTPNTPIPLHSTLLLHCLISSPSTLPAPADCSLTHQSQPLSRCLNQMTSAGCSKVIKEGDLLGNPHQGITPPPPPHPPSIQHSQFRWASH